MDNLNSCVKVNINSQVIKEVLQIIVVLESMAELVMRLTNTEQVID
jgi:hypothetical protein